MVTSNTICLCTAWTLCCLTTWLALPIHSHSHCSSVEESNTYFLSICNAFVMDRKERKMCESCKLTFSVKDPHMSCYSDCWGVLFLLFSTDRNEQKRRVTWSKSMPEEHGPFAANKEKRTTLKAARLGLSNVKAVKVASMNDPSVSLEEGTDSFLT